MRKLAASGLDLLAMVAVGATIWLWWTPLMRYLPNGLADDIDAVIVWTGGAAEPASRSYLRWLADVEWLVGAVVIVLLLWLTEKLVGLIRTHVLRAA